MPKEPKEEITIHCKYDELVDPSSLKPFDRNRNKHSKEQIKHLSKLIKAFGMRSPVVIAKAPWNCIAKGHGTVQAVELLKAKVPIVNQDFPDYDTLYAYVQSDNAIQQTYSELDLAGINTDLPQLGPFDIELLGIKDFELEPADKYGDKDADATPEFRETSISLGDLFRLGEHKLLCGDSTSKEAVARLMNGEKADMWASDPPYGIDHVSTSNEKGQSKGYKKIANDELTDEAFKDFILKTIEASKPFMNKGFAFYMWHAMKMQGYTAAAAAAAAAAGILFHRQIIWVKPSLVFGRGQYHWRHELCLMGWLQGNEPPFYGERNQTTVWEIGRENDKIHPTQKPVAIWEAPIRNHTKQKQIIYEPFAGSGSQVIACEKLSRRCFAMELEPTYVQQCIDRWEKFTGQKAVKI